MGLSIVFLTLCAFLWPYVASVKRLDFFEFLCSSLSALCTLYSYSMCPTPFSFSVRLLQYLLFWCFSFPSRSFPFSFQLRRFFPRNACVVWLIFFATPPFWWRGHEFPCTCNKTNTWMPFFLPRVYDAYYSVMCF